MARIISFINLKGGVGKTTSTVAVAEFLAKDYRKRVLVVDLDPQTNATVALIPQEMWEERDAQGQTLRQLFKDRLDRTNIFDINEAILHDVSNLGGGIPNLGLLPSSLGLVDIQDRLPEISSGNFFAISPIDILRTALLPVLDDYDYVLVDCPPNLGILTLNGIKMSHGYVIPVIPDILSTYGIPQILDRIEAFTRDTGVEVPPRGIIVNKFRAQTTLHNKVLERLRREAQLGKLPQLLAVVSESSQIAESADVESPVNTLRQKYGYGQNYEVYSDLAREFLNL